MKLTVIQTTPNCESSACPTIYQDENGNYFFQGFKVKNQVKSELGVPENEDVIELPEEFVSVFLQGKVKSKLS